MTAKQLYEYILIELNKENAPNLLLEDFNYFANKAINQYVNKRYNIYDVNQQTTDDLRVLKATALLTPHKIGDVYDGLSLVDGGMATYYVDLPMDYLHLLNCICIYNVKKTYKCYNAGDTWRAAATRLTADMYSQVLDNFWTKPTYKRPYYYIHNINTNESVPTNPYNEGKGTDSVYNLIPSSQIIRKYGSLLLLDLINEEEGVPTTPGAYLIHYSDEDRNSNDGIVIRGAEGDTLYEDVDESKFYETIDGRIFGLKSVGFGEDEYYLWDFKENSIKESSEDRSGNIIINYPNKDMLSSIDVRDLGKLSTVERSALQRYGNSSRVRLEIRYGTDNSIFTLDEIPGKKGGKVYIDYIKAPQNIRLTQEELDHTEDLSQVLEFPDYVCQEILNELVHIVMENISHQRLQTHPVVSLSIANPAQALAPEAAGQSAQ